MINFERFIFFNYGFLEITISSNLSTILFSKTFSRYLLYIHPYVIIIFWWYCSEMLTNFWKLVAKKGWCQIIVRDSANPWNHSIWVKLSVMRCFTMLEISFFAMLEISNALNFLKNIMCNIIFFFFQDISFHWEISENKTFFEF